MVDIIVRFSNDVSLREAQEALEVFCDTNQHLLADVQFKG